MSVEAQNLEAAASNMRTYDRRKEQQPGPVFWRERKEGHFHAAYDQRCGGDRRKDAGLTDANIPSVQ